MRFLGFDLGGPTPDENTIRLFRNKLTETGTLQRVMKAFDWQSKKKGYIPIGGQIVDASLVPAPKQWNTEDEKAQIKAGKPAREIWPDQPNKAAQKDTQAPLSWFAGKTTAGQRMDAEDWRQDPVPPGRHTAAADCPAGVRVQVPYRHRPALWLHPEGHCHLGCGS